MELNVRNERSFTGYSRGSELAAAIRNMWKINEHDRDGKAIAGRIESLMSEYDLTLEEWYHWARHCSKYEV